MKRLSLYASMLVLVLPSICHAVDMGVNGTTIVRFEQRSVPGFSKTNVVPATQFLGIDADKLGSEALSLHLYGWGRVDLDQRSTAEKSPDGDLSYGYLNYRFPLADGVFRAGRFFLYEGVAAEQMDGLYARADLAKGFTLSAYGGVPVLLDKDQHSKGDYIVGGRASYRVAGILELGASGLQEGRVLLDKFTGETEDRGLIGADLWLSPVRMIELTGRTSYNTSTGGVGEHSYLLSLRPISPLTLSGEFNEYRFKNYFAFTNTISTVFNSSTGRANSALFDPTTGDILRVYGATVTYMIAKPLEISLDYHHYDRNTLGNSDRFGGDLRLTLLDNKLRTGASWHRLHAATGANSYHEMRAYALMDWGKIQTSVDAISDLYDDKIFDRYSAYELQGSLGYRIVPNVTLSGDVSYGQNPQLRDEVKGLVRLTFNYNTASKGAGK
ncbi:MAG TPA: hypothetical protein VIU40_04455 [Geobacteraceae bacterium]